MIIYTLTQKLNDRLKEQWKITVTHNEMHILEDFLKFLETPTKSLLALTNPNKTDERNVTYSKSSTDRPKFYKNQEGSKCDV